MYAVELICVCINIFVKEYSLVNIKVTISRSYKGKKLLVKTDRNTKNGTEISL